MKTSILRFWLFLGFGALQFATSLYAVAAEPTLYGFDLPQQKAIVSFYSAAAATEDAKKWGKKIEFMEYQESYLLTKLTDYSDGDGRERREKKGKEGKGARLN